MERGRRGGCSSEKVVEEKRRRIVAEPQGGEGESDIPEGGGGGGSRGKPKRERGERSRLEERLRALRHRSHLPTCDKTAGAPASVALRRERVAEFMNTQSSKREKRKRERESLRVAPHE